MDSTKKELPLFTLEELAQVQAEIAAMPPTPLTFWNGQVSRTSMLPYEVTEPDGTKKEAHAVMCGRVMFVSPRFWDYLQRQTKPASQNGDPSGGGS